MRCPTTRDWQLGPDRRWERAERSGYVCVVSGGALYEDQTVVLDDSGVTLPRYYFPVGTAKHVPYAQIRGVTVRPMGWLSGRARLWGTGSLRSWLPLDLRRPAKEFMVVLDLGARVSPAFSPDDPDTVAHVIRDHISG